MDKNEKKSSFYEDFFILKAAPPKRIAQRFLIPAIFGIEIPMEFVEVDQKLLTNTAKDNLKNLRNLIDQQRNDAQQLRNHRQFDPNAILQLIKEVTLNSSDKVHVWFGKMSFLASLINDTERKRELIHAVCLNFEANLEKKRSVWKIFDINDFFVDIRQSELKIEKFKNELGLRCPPEVYNLEMIQSPAPSVTPNQTFSTQHAQLNTAPDSPTQDVYFYNANSSYGYYQPM